MTTTTPAIWASLGPSPPIFHVKNGNVYDFSGNKLKASKESVDFVLKTFTAGGKQFVLEKSGRLSSFEVCSNSTYKMRTVAAGLGDVDASDSAVVCSVVHVAASNAGASALPESIESLSIHAIGAQSLCSVNGGFFVCSLRNEYIYDVVNNQKTPYEIPFEEEPSPHWVTRYTPDLFFSTHTTYRTTHTGDSSDHTVVLNDIRDRSAHPMLELQSYQYGIKDPVCQVSGCVFSYGGRNFDVRQPLRFYKSDYDYSFGFA